MCWRTWAESWPGIPAFCPNRTGKHFSGKYAALNGDIERSRSTFRRVEVIFYYSGHSDEENILLGGERISYGEFKDAIMALKADVRIAILDSCASGAMTLPKGVIRKSPFLLDTAYDMKGYAFMTSSSASEAAQESSRLKRSFFTHNLISGMRGAADMNQDGRITLNEAYQFAFDGTLTQTEKTMAGPQHPSYHIQMSGTGDVVITEIWKSSAVLVFGKDIAGKIYIHNRDNVLLVELKKTGGREISVGLEAGSYRIMNIDDADVWECRVVLESERSLVVDRDRFVKVDRVPTRKPRRQGPPQPPPARANLRWRIEVFSGVMALNPEDLNLRAGFDRLYDSFYDDDQFNYQVRQHLIQSYTTTNSGGQARLLKHAVPLGIRFRYDVNQWLGVSFSLNRFNGSQTSAFKTTFEILELDGSTSVYSKEYLRYRLQAGGYVPALGLHLGRRLARGFEIRGLRQRRGPVRKLQLSHGLQNAIARHLFNAGRPRQFAERSFGGKRQRPGGLPGNRRQNRMARVPPGRTVCRSRLCLSNGFLGLRIRLAYGSYGSFFLGGNLGNQAGCRGEILGHRSFSLAVECLGWFQRNLVAGQGFCFGPVWFSAQAGAFF